MAGGGRTWTVLGDDLLPVVPIEEFLEHHRVLGSSPNTVRSYAKGLQLWWSHLARESVGWEDPGVGTLRAFVTWLRTGFSPGVAPIAPEADAGPAPAEATVGARLAAVVSFYRFQHDVHGHGAALARASMRQVRPGRYRPMLVHLEGRRDGRARRCARSGRVATGRCLCTSRAAATGARARFGCAPRRGARRRC